MNLNERGLTLVELLTAAGIIGFGLVGLMVVVPISSYGLQEGNQLSTATFLAEQRLEHVRSAPWTTTPAPNGNDCLGVGPAGAPTVPGGSSCTHGAVTIPPGGVTFPDEATVPSYPGYGRMVRITDCNVTPCAGITDSGMRLATVTVTYHPLTGVGASAAANRKAVTLSMLIARR